MLDFAAIKTPTSNALKEFDLTTGEDASNFNFYRDCNEALEYIRIIGGDNIASNNFNFTNYDHLKELYLVNINNSTVNIDGCDSLQVFGTGRYDWIPSKYLSTIVPIVPLSNQASPRIVDPGATPSMVWPYYPEKVPSLISTPGVVALTIRNCNNLRRLIMENVGLVSMSFTEIPNLSYLYLSSTDDNIVGASNNSMTLNAKGGFLAEAISTLSSRVGEGMGAGIAVIRCINDEMTNFVAVPLSSSPYAQMMGFGSDNNWTIDLYSGYTLD